MKPKYLAILSGIAVVLLGVLIWMYLPGGGPGPATLSATILNAEPGSEEARKAMIQLAMKRGPQAATEIKKVIAGSQDPEVLTLAIGALSRAGTFNDMPVIYESLDHKDQRVRMAAYEVLKNQYGGNFPNNLKYSVNDPPAKRAEVVKGLKEYWEEKREK